MSGSVGTLRKLARFYKTNILDFFDASGASQRQVRPAERKVLEAGAGVRMELLAWGNTVMEPHLFRIAPEAGSGDPYTHEGEEFIYVLRGDLAIAVEWRRVSSETRRQLLLRKCNAPSLEESGPQGNLGSLGEHSAHVLGGRRMNRQVRRRGQEIMWRGHSCPRQLLNLLRLHMKSLVRSALVLAALLCLVSCTKKTPTLNLLVWEGYADPSFIQSLRRTEPLQSYGVVHGFER